MRRFISASGLVVLASCNPPHVPDGSGDVVIRDRAAQVLRLKGWTPVLIPREQEVFSVGTLFDDEAKQRVRDTVESACGKRPTTKTGSGSDITENASDTLTITGSSGLNGQALAAFLPNVKVSGSVQGITTVDVSYTDVTVAQTTKSDIEEAASCCTKLGPGRSEAVSALLLGKFRVRFLDKSGHHVDVEAGWKDVGATTEIKLDKQKDGSYSSEKPVVFAYQALGFEVPPCATCGTMRAHAVARCTSDTPGQYPTKIEHNDDQYEVSNLATLPNWIGPTVDYSSNGGSNGRAIFKAFCDPIVLKNDHVRVAVDLLAKTGGRCGRNGSNAGGSGGVNPEWKTKLALPGEVSREIWDLTLSAHADRKSDRAACVLLFDGAQKMQLAMNGLSDPLTFGAEPGDHVVTLECTGTSPWRGCYGGNEGEVGELMEKVHVMVNAVRHRHPW